MRYVLTILWYLLPGIFGNMAPVFAKKIFKDKFNHPIDFKRKFMGKSILGNHKTFRGYLSGVLVSTIIIYIQSFFYKYDIIKSISLFDYHNSSIFLIGFLMGFGTLFMDSFKSFFKRRISKKPGAPWVPFDQMDMLLGYFVFVIPFFPIDPKYYIGIIIISPLWAITSTNLGFLLKIKDTKW